MNRMILMTAGVLGACGTAYAEHFDGSFNSGLVAAYSHVSDLEAVALLELPDGKLLVVNSGNYFPNLTLNLETRLQNGGVTGATTEQYDLPGIVAAAIDSKGRRVVVGTTLAGGTGTDFRVARILPDGSADTSFGIGGRVAIDFSTQNDYGLAVALDKDDNIVVAGSATLSATDTDFAVARLSAGNGSILSAVLIPFDLAAGQRLDQASAVSIANDGRILVGGTAYDPAINKFRVALARLTPGGSIDTTFCSPSCNFQGAYTGINSGRRIYYFGSSDAHSDQLFGMESIGNGDFYVVGTSSPSDGSGPKAAIAKLNSAANYVTEMVGTTGGVTNYRSVKSVDGLGTRLLVSGDAGNGMLYLQAFSNGLTPLANYGNCLAGSSGFCLSSRSIADAGPNKAGPITIDRLGRPLLTGSFVQDPGGNRGVLMARFSNDSGPLPDRIFRNGF